MQDPDFERARARMVELDIRGRGVTDARVVAALRRVPRHLFVPAHIRHRAYEDRPLDIGHAQTISQPYMVGFMTEILDLQPTDRVLEIGTGSGYQAAVLAELAAEVVTIERLASLAGEARQRLADLGYANVSVVVGDGTRGCPDLAPFDAILVTAGAPRLPEGLKMQLAQGGRLVCPVGPRDLQHLLTITRCGESWAEHTSIGCIFVPLIGENGWDA